MSALERTGETVALSRNGPLWSWSAVCLVLAHLAGCAIQGPDVMRASRLAYNEAVQVSDQRELVLNLVRLRYTDAPEFLAINGISTQMNFQMGASIGGEFGEEADKDTALVSPGASVGYSETPTITFTPQRDKVFTRQLVAPVELDSMYLLTQYGWGIDRVLRLVARDLNGLSNAISRETNGTRDAESLILFADIASRLRRLEEAQLISIGMDQRREVLSAPIPTDRIAADDLLSALDAGYRLEYLEDPPAYVLSGSRSHYVLRVDRDAWDHADFMEVARLFGLPEHQATYEIDPGGSLSVAADGRLHVATRSVLGTMAYLSNAVSVPETHTAQGLVSTSGDIEALLNDLLNIHVSGTPVEDAYLSVPYRDFWYYVDESDLTTKRTLGLLTSLVRLTISAGGAQNVPILTLPVTR